MSSVVVVDPTASAGPADPAQTLARAWREEGARLRASLLRTLRDLALVDDALAAAAEQALRSWPDDGVPAVPAAWLLTVARRKAIDVLRKQKRFAHRDDAIADLQSALAHEEHGEHEARDHTATRPAPTLLDEDRLRLVFVSCHPALPEEHRVALTLQAVGGLTADEIARAFLVPHTTMEKRLVRAKKELKQKGVAFAVPPPAELPARVHTVLAVLYLVFNAGYLASKGDALIRADLCEEAIRLARLVRALLSSSSSASSSPSSPSSPSSSSSSTSAGDLELAAAFDEAAAEAAGLLALLLFTHARRAARVDDAGDLVLLDDQDRSRWDRALIDEAQHIVDALVARASTRRTRPGPHQIQAAIAALHAEAGRSDATTTTTTTTTTDWAQIAALYAGLMRQLDTPVVRLNHAVAVAMAHGVDAGLSLVEALGRAGALDGYHLYWATRADLLRKKGDVGAARRAYQRARTLAPSAAEKAFLTKRLTALTSSSMSSRSSS